MRVSRNSWLFSGFVGVGLFFVVMFCAIFLNITSPLFAIFSFPAYYMTFNLLGVTHSQPWILYIFFFGVVTNFLFGAAIGYLIQSVLTGRGRRKRR